METLKFTPENPIGHEEYTGLKQRLPMNYPAKSRIEESGIHYDLTKLYPHSQFLDGIINLEEKTYRPDTILELTFQNQGPKSSESKLASCMQAFPIEFMTRVIGNMRANPKIITERITEPELQCLEVDLDNERIVIRGILTKEFTPQNKEIRIAFEVGYE